MCPETFASDYARVSPLVVDLYTKLEDDNDHTVSEGNVNVGCWRNVLMDSDSGNTTALESVLCRYATCIGCTTSGVEQINRNKHEWLFDRRRGALGDGNENNKVKIVCDYCESEDFS